MAIQVVVEGQPPVVIKSGRVAKMVLYLVRQQQRIGQVEKGLLKASLQRRGKGFLMKRGWLVMGLVLVMLLAVARPVLAQEETPPGVQPLQTTLDLLAQGIGAGFVIAFLAEKVKMFQALQPGQKSVVILALSVGLPVLARLALQFIPPNVWTVVEPYWQSVAVGFLGWAGSQLAYQRVVKPAQARK